MVPAPHPQGGRGRGRPAARLLRDRGAALPEINGESAAAQVASVGRTRPETHMPTSHISPIRHSWLLALPPLLLAALELGHPVIRTGTAAGLEPLIHHAST